MVTQDSRDSERGLAEFWTEYRESSWRGARYLVRHPVALWRAVQAIRALPVVDADPSSTPGGGAVLDVVGRRGPLGTPARILGNAVLRVPEDPDEHLVGSSAQTLRRKIRLAERAGTTWHRVAGPAEKHRLLELANDAERRHADPRYVVPDPDNDDLLEHDLWLVAEDAEGTPILLSVTPVDGRLATLRYFRTLGSGPAFSDARYLVTHALVRELSALGVRWLLDTEPPGAQTNGVREFQRMVGFRYVRIRLP